MADFDTFSFGGVTYPLTESTANSLLEDADPAIHYFLEFIETVLKRYVGARLLAEAALVGFNFPSAVEQKIHFEPDPLLIHQFKFPLLAVYRKQDEFSEKTVTFDQEMGNWEFAYLLPPLMPTQRERLDPIFRAVGVVVQHCIGQRFDPSYAGGAKVWELAGITKAHVATVRYGGYEHVDGQVAKMYRAALGTILVSEQEVPNLASFQQFEGGNIHVDQQSADGSTLEDVVELQTQQAPTFAAVNPIVPNSGTKAGGTAFTINGERFLAPAKVVFQGAPPVDVVVVNSTTITGVTPPHYANPDFIADVTVINADGQIAHKSAAFTFTTP